MTATRRCAAALLASALPGLAVPAGARARPVADAAQPAPRHANALARAPAGPPLTSAGTAQSGSEEGGDGNGGQAQADPLVANGLGSPLCRGGGELSAAARHNCATSGFVASGAPTGDYGLDVHIDTGLFGLSAGTLLRIVQDLVIAPIWMAVVWIVHAVVVMLEWSFTIDLLDSSAAGGLGVGLRAMQSAVTEPWLALVLAGAGVAAAYNGLIRRRVAETLGQTLLMMSMIIGGMWVISDPTGTVGALARLANAASLGTMAAAARGSPERAGGTLADSMARVFTAAIDGPWCYLEFGDVAWCREPSRLDPRLHAAGQRIAAALGPARGCAAPAGTCGAAAASATLLRGATTNGELFLALPANGPQRNSINDEGSLLRTLCQSSDATACRGPTAAQAEFRTGMGTWPRVGGLLLIVAGVTGVVLLLGFIALRLLTAALFSLLYLLLAPGVVLAPAFGESGRAVFSAWLSRLLGAVVAKLVFSFVLGIVLAVLALLSALRLGWWTQWLLISAFVWTAFIRRHQALRVTHGAVGRDKREPRRALGGRAGEMTQVRTREAVERWRMRRREQREASTAVERQPPAAARALDGARSDPQAARMVMAERGRRRLDANWLRPGPLQRDLASRRAQLERVRTAQTRARATGKRRRALELGHRAQRVEEHIAHGEAAGRGSALADAAHLPADQRSAEARTFRERARFLDGQAQLPSMLEAARAVRSGAPRSGSREYSSLAPLAGLARGEYEGLGPGAARQARLRIDRELDRRREYRRLVHVEGVVTHEPGSAHPQIPERRGRPAGGSGDAHFESGAELPESRDAWADVRAVVEGRKKELGFGRP